MISNFKNPALALYFLSYVLYLFFFKIYDDKEISLLFKPMIVTSISFYYFFNNGIDGYKNKMHYVVFLLLFVADNLSLMLEDVFTKGALFVYSFIMIILFYFLLEDSRIFKKQNKLVVLRVILFMCVMFSILIKLISTYWLTKDFSVYYNVLFYTTMAIGILIMSAYNFFKKKTMSSKFLLITFVSLFGSDTLYVMYKYYSQHEIWLYASCLIEIPSYFFLVKYFMFRDQENSVVTIQ
ncbi:hypothetical protein [Flavobacterium sp. U410]|jgi:hypothetical protein